MKTKLFWFLRQNRGAIEKNEGWAARARETSSVEETTDRNLCCHCQTLLLFLLHTHAHRHILLSEWNLLDRHIFTTTHISFNVKYTPIFFIRNTIFRIKSQTNSHNFFFQSFNYPFYPRFIERFRLVFEFFFASDRQNTRRRKKTITVVELGETGETAGRVKNQKWLTMLKNIKLKFTFLWIDDRFY